MAQATTNQPAFNLNVTLSAFIAADVKNDKIGQHTIRLSFVAKALDAALRGNATQYDQAVTQAGGKTQKGRAYAAGFAAVPRPSKWDYKGKLTQDVADAIAAEAERLTGEFSAAFLSVMPLEGKPLTDEQKAERKAKREASEREAAETLARSLGWTAPGDAAKPREFTIAELSPAALADVIVSMVQSGQFGADNLRAMAGPINAALKSAEQPAAKADKPAKAVKGKGLQALGELVATGTPATA